MGKPASNRLAILTKTYPKLSETFILGELLGLEKRGFELFVFSMQHPTDELQQPAASDLRAPVTYLAPRSMRERLAMAAAHLLLIGRHPIRYARTLAFALSRQNEPPLSMFVKAGFLARRLAALGTPHLHVHFAGTPADVAELAARLTGISYSVSAHAKDIFLSSPESLRRKLGAARFTVTCSDYNCRYLREIVGTESPVVRMYHGIQVERFSPKSRSNAPDARPLILSVGRLREKKGFPDLIGACRLLKDRGVSLRCSIVGYGPDDDRLRQLIASLDLDDVVTLAGKMTQERLIEWYRQATIFVLPCRVGEDGDRDGIPNVLLEAMAMELPVVSTTVSGIAEAVIDGETGLLVDPAQPTRLADKIGWLLDRPEERRRLGRLGRQLVGVKFDPKNNLIPLVALLEDNGIRPSDPVTPSEETPAAGPEIAYILKGFPRFSEPFIAHEIHLLEAEGLRLKLFSIKPGEYRQLQPVTAKIRAPLTQLPEVASVSQTPLRKWLQDHLGKFTDAHAELCRLRPGAYVATLLSALAMCRRYRKGPLAKPRKVFIKEFLQAGTIALDVLKCPSIRHLHGHFCHGATTITWYVSRLTGLPFSFTAHAKDIYQTKLNPKDLLPRKLRAARFAVTCTEANRAHLQRLAPDSVVVHRIYHGLDVADFSSTRGSQESRTVPLILAVGRFTAKKGFPDLIEACARLRARRFSFRCKLVGERGDDFDHVCRKIDELGLGDLVTLEGSLPQDRLKAIYRRASIFALPCRVVDDGDRDGIPNVLVEALAMGIPAISTAISGIPELIEDGVTGLLVPASDSAALAAAIARLLSDEALRARLIGAGRRKVCAEFDAVSNTRALRQLFLDVLQTEVQTV